MYNAKLQRTEETTRGLDIYVDFYKDGIFSHTENVIPQDRAGFKHWLDSRILSLNTSEQLKTELVVGQVIDLSKPEDAPTPEEIKKREYEASKYELLELKKEVELGLATQAEFDAKVQEIKDAKESSVIDTK